MNDFFLATPHDMPYPARINTVGLELAATSKRGLGDYESVTAKCTVFFSVQPGCSNEDMSDIINAYRVAVGEVLATLIDDGVKTVKTGLAGKKVKKMLGLPVYQEAQFTVTTSTLPAPAPMDIEIAKSFVASGGKPYGELTPEEITSAIIKIEEILSDDIDTGQQDALLVRRSALYALKGGQN